MNLCKNRIQLALFIGWVILLSVPLSYIVGSHFFALQTEKPTTLSAFVHPEDRKFWTLIHVLTEDCGCSKSVAEYLSKRHVMTHVAEHVLWVGDKNDVSASLEKIGFQVKALSQEEAVERFNIQSTPLLIVTNEQGQRLYEGGYGPRKPSPTSPFEEQSIVKKLQAGETVSAFPVFGCVIGSNLRNTLDPFHVRYSKENKRHE